MFGIFTIARKFQTIVFDIRGWNIIMNMIKMYLKKKDTKDVSQFFDYWIKRKIILFMCFKRNRNSHFCLFYNIPESGSI